MTPTCFALLALPGHSQLFGAPVEELLQGARKVLEDRVHLFRALALHAGRKRNRLPKPKVRKRVVRALRERWVDRWWRVRYICTKSWTTVGLTEKLVENLRSVLCIFVAPLRVSRLVRNSVAKGLEK